MKRSLLADICCPTCSGAFDLQETGLQDDNVIEGALQCVRCSSMYPIHKGIPNLMPQQVRMSVAQEAEGWVSIWRRKGFYSDDPALENTFKYPHVVGPGFARMFEIALQEMNLKGDEVILDLGAGLGWASSYFAKKGCRAIAVDVVDDEYFGLGRSWAIMEREGVYFEPLLADGEILPFPPNKFDIVFFSSTLHHFEQFDRVLEQLYRVLKPGGSLIASVEPSVSIFTREQDVQAILEETREGITERRPKAFQYWWALRQAGFKAIHIDIAETYDASPAQIYDWIRNAGHNLYQAVGRRHKPFVWLAFRFFRILPCRWAFWLALCVNGGDVFMRADKPVL